jgi:hypothetical protein
MNISIVIWKGLSTSNKPVSLIASIGGNKATGQVVELTLVPTFIIEQWAELTAGVKPAWQGVPYVKALRSEIESVCPSTCAFVMAGKRCYVQHNPRNASQVARIIRNCEAVTNDGLYLSELRYLLKCAKLAGIAKVRSMVAGDASMIPAAVWSEIESSICKVYPAKQWLGYTHDHSATHLQKTHVASCDSKEQALLALSKGWNVYQVIDAIGEEIPTGAALCPKSKEFELKRGFLIGCAGCPMACTGASSKNWRVVPRHASGDSSRKRAAARRGEVLKNEKGQIKGLYA